ncbi:MAG: hypothetical protein K0M45_03640 [Candidatus Paracaedibacteraceae bacterium]|nr:hypothetical protein [Candidatus Paracaedibacteraceae bacterium]
MTHQLKERLSNFLVAIISILFVFHSSSAFESDEPPGAAERGWGGYTTFQRIAELESEGVLDVRTNVRIVGNFNRLSKQVENLKEENKTLQDSLTTIFSTSIPTLRRCIFQNITMKKTIDALGGSIKHESEHIINNEAILTECLKEYENSLTSLLKEKHSLPLRRDASPLGEHAGWYERSIGLRTVHRKIRDLEKENILDVRSHIRVKDNLNRVREQIIELKEEINSQIDHFNYPKEIAVCVRSAAEFAQIVSPDISMIHAQFMHCFHNPLLESKLPDRSHILFPFK